MKSILVAPMLFLATPTLGCLHTWGYLNWFSNSGYTFVDVHVDDNGSRVCDSDWGWRIDNDGHPSLTCLDGYIYATNGETSWYANNGGGSFTIDNVSWVFEGYSWHWDQTLFC